MTAPELQFTGERLVPGQVDRQLMEEHVARYQFALASLGSLPDGAKVLDLACGAGYGTQMLAQAGWDALGVDVSGEAVAWASHTFGATPHLAYQVADVGATGLPAATYAGIVAFEILEHLHEPLPLLREIHRLLAPGGIALVSTPNREAHTIAGENEFHHQEYSVTEFRSLLAEIFPGYQIAIHAQHRGNATTSGALVGLKKVYISAKRAVGLGPLIAKAKADWDPGMDLRTYPHPYTFPATNLERAEYLIAILHAPGAV
ncbi:MAG: class I SAM-dependent methyltransferase [bacterium]